ncbi:MAG: hypothetical protein IT204_01530 [Fimbriimonadaceae bacterium]|nr:hypothetical protein [Fimbriimonadaceae bacterium]
MANTGREGGKSGMGKCLVGCGAVAALLVVGGFFLAKAGLAKAGDMVKTGFEEGLKSAAPADSWDVSLANGSWLGLAQGKPCDLKLVGKNVQAEGTKLAELSAELKGLAVSVKGQSAEPTGLADGTITVKIDEAELAKQVKAGVGADPSIKDVGVKVDGGKLKVSFKVEQGPVKLTCSFDAVPKAVPPSTLAFTASNVKASFGGLSVPAAMKAKLEKEMASQLTSNMKQDLSKMGGPPLKLKSAKVEGKQMVVVAGIDLATMKQLMAGAGGGASAAPTK